MMLRAALRDFQQRSASDPGLKQRWIATSEVVADRSDIAASETPRRPRGLRRIS